MTFEEIREEMLAFEPIAVLIRKFIKVKGVSDSIAVEVLREVGVIPSTTTMKQFQDHELRRSMYKNWKRGRVDDCAVFA